jgi:hypothetical protein
MSKGRGSPPTMGKAYRGNESSGEKGFGTGKAPAPKAEAPVGKAYSAGQEAGVKGFAVDPQAKKF